MKNPIIITIDLETSPQKGYFFGSKWETNIVSVTEHQVILSYSAKFLNGKQITKGLPDYRGYRMGSLNDKNIVKDIWNLLDEADVVITQNGRDFDHKVLNARFAYHGLTPPSPFKTVDTKVAAKSALRLPSNSLDDLCAFFGIGRKVPHEGIELWFRCMEGSKWAWSTMKAYNAHDTALTEKLYLKLLPWIKNHPNLGMYTDRPVCPNCMKGDRMQSRGPAINKTTKYNRFQCQYCGAWARDYKNIQLTKPLVSI